MVTKGLPTPRNVLKNFLLIYCFDFGLYQTTKGKPVLSYPKPNFSLFHMLLRTPHIPTAKKHGKPKKGLLQETNYFLRPLFEGEETLFLPLFPSFKGSIDRKWGRQKNKLSRQEENQKILSRLSYLNIVLSPIILHQSN